MKSNYCSCLSTNILYQRIAVTCWTCYCGIAIATSVASVDCRRGPRRIWGEFGICWHGHKTLCREGGGRHLSCVWRGQLPSHNKKSWYQQQRCDVHNKPHSPEQHSLITCSCQPPCLYPTTATRHRLSPQVQSSVVFCISFSLWRVNGRMLRLGSKSRNKGAKCEKGRREGRSGGGSLSSFVWKKKSVLWCAVSWCSVCQRVGLRSKMGGGVRKRWGVGGDVERWWDVELFKTPLKVGGTHIAAPQGAMDVLLKKPPVCLQNLRCLLVQRILGVRLLRAEEGKENGMRYLDEVGAAV